MKNTIIQWNCRGLRANYDELQLLLNDYDPAVVCLQETYLKEPNNVTFRNYNLFNTFAVGDGRGTGGVAIIINNKCPSSQIHLKTNIQAVAVSVTLHRTISICSIYIPPRSKIVEKDLDEIVNQLPTPFLLLGDFNGHNFIWGSDDVNDKGRIIENFINKNNLCLYNNKTPTYLHPATGTYTSLDLSICYPTLLLDYEWKVHDDLCGSDHFPIFLNNIAPQLEEPITRWKLTKADWPSFKALCETEINDTILQADDPIDRFTTTLHQLAIKTIPRTSIKSKKKKKPWFNDDCKTSIQKRKQALRQFNARPLHQNLENFRIFRAKARRTIRESKRKSWKQYVSRLNSRTSIKKVWDMVRKIQGKGKSTSVNHLKKNNDNITSKKDIANTLADSFSKNSSSENYTSKFRNIKNQQEKQKLKFTSDNTENYNSEFLLSELTDALSKAHDTSPGPDDIHYQLLKHLPTSTLLILLEIFNNIWKTGNIPKSWKEATVIPIPKPDKDHTDPTNYRPIALTSCICKTMERMINDRLTWFLEANNIIKDYQSGFRRHRSTNDHLVRLETFIREAFIKKEHLVTIFFDLEKAYDTTWKYGIMKNIHDIGLKGRLPLFIQNFLNDREFKVKVGSTLSELHKQEQGVPQGSILSVTLFSIKINDIVKNINPGDDCSLYVDDFLICYRSKNMHTIERQLQQNLNNIQDWASKNGFKFSKSKTVCMHFCQLRKAHDDPVLTLDGTPIPVVEETKFLGVIFDKKLTFIPHIKKLKAKCQKALNLLRVVAHTDWGADRKVLLHLYRTIVRSKLDYGSIVYGSARESYLKTLDTIHHQGIRLALGAFRTSPADSLLVEANEPSLNDRREKLSLQFALKLKSNRSNPTYNTVFRPNYFTLFQNKPNAIPTFGIRIAPTLNSAGIKVRNIQSNSILNIPPWTIKQPKVLFTLTTDKKETTDSSIFRTKFQELSSEYPDFQHIYTDGSKDGPNVASACVSQNHTRKCRLPDNASIFTAEIQAINMALDYIKDANLSKVLIFSDSLSVLQSINNCKLDNPLVQDILLRFHNLSSKHIILCWLPSHTGIKGNEKADLAAKSALLLPPSNFKLPYTDFKPVINKYLFNKWQSVWDTAVHNKLHSIKPILSEWRPAYRMDRKEEVVLTRLRIGHSYATHSYLLKGEEQPMCIPCDTPFTIKHVLLYCVDFENARNRYYRVSTLKELFESVEISNIFLYLKEIGLYTKL